MANTFPRSLPNLDDIMDIQITRKSVVGVTEGMFSLAQQAQKHSPGRWEVEYTIVPLNRADIDEWWAWLASLNGREKTFYAVLQAPNEPKGSATSYANPQAAGAHVARTNSLSIDGGPVSVTNYLRYGDYFQIGTTTDSRIYMALENVSTNGAGEATFDIWPDLYAPLTDNQSIYMSAPVGVFRLKDNTHELRIDNTPTRKGLRFSATGVI